MRIGDFESKPFQSINERWHHARSNELADNFAILDTPLFELENHLRRDRASLHAGDFGKLN